MAEFRYIPNEKVNDLVMYEMKKLNCHYVAHFISPNYEGTKRYFYITIVYNNEQKGYSKFEVVDNIIKLCKNAGYSVKHNLVHINNGGDVDNFTDRLEIIKIKI